MVRVVEYFNWYADGSHSQFLYPIPIGRAWCIVHNNRGTYIDRFNFPPIDELVVDLPTDGELNALKKYLYQNGKTIIERLYGK